MDKRSVAVIGQMRKVLDEGDEVRKYIRPKEGIGIYSMSRTLLEEHARRAGAMYKIGKLVLIVDMFIVSQRVLNKLNGMSDDKFKEAYSYSDCCRCRIEHP